MGNEPKAPRRSMSEYMPLLADEFVQNCKRNGIALDYLPRTLPYVDRILEQARTNLHQLVAKKDPQAANYHMQYTTWMAAYVGEVIRRETRGVWFDIQGEPEAVLDIGTDHATRPLLVVQSLMEKRRVEADGEPLDTTKAYFEATCRKQRQWLDRMVLGKYESIAALRTSMSAEPKTAGLILGLAQSAILAAKLDWRESLDCSAESLDAVERILGRMHEFTSGSDQVTEDQIATVSKMIGAYVGEVIRRRYGGAWSVKGDGVVELVIGEATMFPIGKVRKRIVDGPADNIPFYFRALETVLR